MALNNLQRLICQKPTNQLFVRHGHDWLCKKDTALSRKVLCYWMCQRIYGCCNDKLKTRYKTDFTWGKTRMAINERVKIGWKWTKQYKNQITKINTWIICARNYRILEHRNRICYSSPSLCVFFFFCWACLDG